MTECKYRPLIGVPACIKELDSQQFHTVGDKYVRALAVSAEALPVMIPSLEMLVHSPDLIDRLDGLMLTGSPSNVHPSRYNQDPTSKHEPFDEWRDATVFPLIREALDRGLPLLAICRGFQELNVALGGSLHARVHELPDRMDHRRPQHPDLDVQYGVKHSIALKEGGAIAALAGCSELEINSLHWQAIDRLADGLVAEAHAPDGTIEAVRVKNATSFALGVQWHPEYKSWENPFSRRLFAAFGDAARARAAGTQAGHDKASDKDAEPARLANFRA